MTKYAEAHWQHLQTPIFGAIMDFYASGKPALLDVPEITDTTILEDDSEVVAMIKELLESRIRPAVQEDGKFSSYKLCVLDSVLMTYWNEQSFILVLFLFISIPVNHTSFVFLTDVLTQYSTTRKEVIFGT